MADVELREIDGDELGQILRQARDIEIGDHVADDRAGHLHGGRALGVGEVQRHFHVNLAVLVDALEIDVQDLVLERVHLHVTQQHLGRLAVDAHVQDRRVEGLVAQRVKKRVMVELDRLGFLRSAVYDAGGFARAAHAPARSAALGGAGESGEFDSHGCDS